MIKRLCLLFFFSLSISLAYSQFDTAFAKANIRYCADSMTTGFKTKNWELFARYSHAGLIGSMGGKKEFMKYMEEMFLPIPGTAWKQYEPGKILQVIKMEGDLQAVIELKSILEWQGRRINTVTHLIGQSWDGGLFWTFFDSEGDRAMAKAIKPDLSDELIIPKKTEQMEPLSPAPKTKNKR